jgi:hypothetical protein
MQICDQEKPARLAQDRVSHGDRGSLLAMLIRASPPSSLYVSFSSAQRKCCPQTMRNTLDRRVRHADHSYALG